LGQVDLHEIIEKIKSEADENVLASFLNFEDAGAYKVSDDIAIVQSIDVITPVVNDPFTYGQICAANALSDIYAMGADPITALIFAGLPLCDFDDDLLVLIQKGAIDKLHEAGCRLIGGHTVNDIELKYGLSITGTAHPDKIIYNRTARVGDDIIITKPIGNGIITTARKSDMAEDTDIIRSVDFMTTLNKTACSIMKKYDVSACTDVTGFGLLGHMFEVAHASQVTLELNYSDIPVLNGAFEYASLGLVPGGSHSNEQYLADKVEYDKPKSPTEVSILCDPQTSGGLLIFVNKNNTKNLLKDLQDNSIIHAQLIGRVSEKQNNSVIVY